MRPIALVFSAALAGVLAGCTMGGKQAAPVTTGSIEPAVQVEGPLPQTLAYSDAAMIGAAASSQPNGPVGSEAGAPGRFEWINAATGSSGTLEDLPAPAPVAEADPSRACKVFNTIVTSFAGVHKYNGRLCRSNDGRRTVSIDAPAPTSPDPASAPDIEAGPAAAAPVGVPTVRAPAPGETPPVILAAG